jgi:hypothetical protein
MYQLQLRWSQKPIKLGIMLSILYFERVHLRRNTEPTFLTKLYRITAHSTECVEHIGRTGPKPIHDPLRYVLSHWLWRDRVP